MGLLKAGAGALGGVLADQWRDYFYCDALDASILAAKGKKRTSRRSSNTKGDENIISNGSILAVNEGQCMLKPGNFSMTAVPSPLCFTAAWAKAC